MKLKVTTVGNSFAVILPKQVASELNVKEDDSLWLTACEGGKKLTAYDPDFEQPVNSARNIMKKRRNVLRELAK